MKISASGKSYTKICVEILGCRLIQDMPPDVKLSTYIKHVTGYGTVDLHKSCRDVELSIYTRIVGMLTSRLIQELSGCSAVDLQKNFPGC